MHACLLSACAGVPGDERACVLFLLPVCAGVPEAERYTDDGVDDDPNNLIPEAEEAAEGEEGDMEEDEFDRMVGKNKRKKGKEVDPVQIGVRSSTAWGTHTHSSSTWGAHRHTAPDGVHTGTQQRVGRTHTAPHGARAQHHMGHTHARMQHRMRHANTHSVTWGTHCITWGAHTLHHMAPTAAAPQGADTHHTPTCSPT